MSDEASSFWTVPPWPEFGLASDIRPALGRALAAGRASVMVSLHSVEGAAPLGEGAQMLFDQGAVAGFLSGGCVEGDVALHARAALEDGRPRWLIYGRGGPPDIRLLCGSGIRLLLERIDPADRAARRLMELTQARRSALWLSDGLTRACLAEGEPESLAPASRWPALAAAEGSSALAGGAEGAIFRRHAPRARLAVVGGDPIALAIARLADEAGFETALIRPKGPAEPPPLPGVRYFRDEPAQAFQALGLDRWTAVAIATHDIEIDHAALAVALPSPSPYVGALGSRRRLPERLARLKAEGVDPAVLSRLKAPIGLDIGARSPWHIAVSVIAEAIQTLAAEEARRVWPAALAPV